MSRFIRKLGENLKKSILTMKRNLLPIFLAFVLTIVMVPERTVSSISVIAQTNSRTTIYLDPSTIDGAVIGVNNTLTVNLNISDARNITGWQAGLLFNASVLECTSFENGEFLNDVGDTLWLPGTIDNTLGVISIHACGFLGNYKVSGSGQLAYLTFRVKAPGVSDLHLRNVDVTDITLLPVRFNIIDVYTVVVNTTHYNVVTVSDSTGKTGTYHSGFYDHAFNASGKEISFKVTTPKTSSFSNVTIPKTLLSPETLYGWGVIIDSRRLSTEERTVTENATHTSIYFTYGEGIHEVHIATRFLSSTISLALSSTTAGLGWNVTINGNIDPTRANVTVTIEYRPSGGTWTTLATRTTDSNSNYSYTWTPQTAGTYEIRARWEGDTNTLGDISDIQTLKVIPKELVVSLDAPEFVRISSSSLLNVTVYNFGPDDEINVTLQLFINGSMVNSTVISLFEVNSSYTLSHLWTAPTVEATINVTAYAPPLENEIVTTNNVATKFITVTEVLLFPLDPESGPIGTKVTLKGTWFPANQTQLPVTFNDMLIGYAMTDDAGNLAFVFNIPVSAAGNQTIKIFYTEAKYAYEMFTVIDVTPLNIKIDVGTTHFRGESAEFYIQTSFKGVAVNATSISALLYKPDGTTEPLTVPSPIATSFYKTTYAIPVDAQNGTYTLVVEADYTTSTIESHGTAFKAFLLSSTLAEELAMIEDLGVEIENLKAEISALNTTLNSLGETLTEELALMEEDLKAQIATLNTTLNSLNEAIAQLETRINTIKSAQEAFTPPLYATVVLALIAAVGAIVTILLRRKPTP